MYTTVQSSPRRWNSVAPVICILLLGLILFAVAATIILSLISLYLPTHNINAVSTSSSAQQVTIGLSSGSNIATGSLNNGATTSLQTQLKNAVSSSAAAQDVTNVQVTNAVGTTSGKVYVKNLKICYVIPLILAQTTTKRDSKRCDSHLRIDIQWTL
jgi:biopolymer transport protein ExbD